MKVVSTEVESGEETPLLYDLDNDYFSKNIHEVTSLIPYSIRGLGTFFGHHLHFRHNRGKSSN